MPAGTKLALGAFLGDRLIGAVTFGVGPMSGHRLLRDPRPQDGITLTRFVLLPERPANSASRVLGIVLRMLRRQTDKKFVLTYADPEHGHHGGIYQASGFIYGRAVGAAAGARLGRRRAPPLSPGSVGVRDAQPRALRPPRTCRPRRARRRQAHLPVGRPGMAGPAPAAAPVLPEAR